MDDFKKYDSAGEPVKKGSKVIDLDAHRPHVAGEAVCLACGDESITVAPAGVSFMECSACGCWKKVFRYPVTKEGAHWYCVCGNDLFHIMQDKTYCPHCGTIQTGY